MSSEKDMGKLLADGMLNYQYKNYQKSIDVFKETLEEDLKNDTIFFYLGLNYLALERDSEALKYFKQASDLNPKNLDYLYYSNLCDYYLKNLDKSLLGFNSIIKMDSTYSYAHYGKGLALFAKEKYEDAYKQFSLAKKGMEMGDQFNQYYYLLYFSGASAFAIKNYENCINDYQFLMDNSDADTAVYNLYAESCFSLNRKELSCDSWYKAKSKGSKIAEQNVIKYCSN